MKKSKIGLIGGGYWGKNLMRNLNGLGILGGVADLSQTNLQYVTDTYSSKVFTTLNYMELLEKEDIVGVIVATPPETHFDIALDCLKYNKHCLVEKPMTTTVDTAKQLIALAAKRNLILMVDHTFLYTGAVQKIKEIIDSGELGELYFYKSDRANLGLLQKNINVAWDLITHDFYILDYLFNKSVVKIFAQGSKFIGNQEEVSQIILNLGSTAVAYIYASWLSPVKTRQITIVGSKKMIFYDDIEPVHKIKVFDKGVTIKGKPIYKDAGVYIPVLNTNEALKAECEHFYNCIFKKDKPLVDGISGLRAVELLEKANQSILLNRGVKCQ